MPTISFYFAFFVSSLSADLPFLLAPETNSIGLQRASELALLGDPIPPQKLQEWGIVNKVVQHEKLIPTALSYARKICQNSPDAVIVSRTGMLMSMERKSPGIVYPLSLFHFFESLFTMWICKRVFFSDSGFRIDAFFPRFITAVVFYLVLSCNFESDAEL